MPPESPAGAPPPPPRHRPRKRFGQHFLHDRGVVARIVGAVAPAAGERIVEIGPGEGVLTGPLLERVDRLDVVEIDRDLAAALPARLGHPDRLTVHCADALEFDYDAIAPAGSRLRVVGNLPYNISTPLLFHLLDQSRVTDMHLMLQKEVVDRLVAGPGNPSYGRLSVMAAVRARAERLFTVDPGAFRPPPKVRSAVVRMRVLESPEVTAREREAFARVVSAAFSGRRKTLRNSLRRLLDADTIRASGVDPGSRAETVAPAGYIALARAMEPPRRRP